MLEDAVVVEFFSRVASGLFWNMVDSGLKKRESAKESVLHREIARLNAACRKKCFQDIYDEIVDDLKKTEPEAINLSTEALGVFVKEQILSEGKQWAYSLVRKAKEKYALFKTATRLAKKIADFNEFWALRSDGSFDAYGKAYYQQIRSGDRSIKARLHLSELAAKYRLRDEEVAGIKNIVEDVFRSKPFSDPVGVSGAVVIDEVETKQLEEQSLRLAERVVVLCEWVKHGCVFMDDDGREIRSIKSRAEALLDGEDDLSDELS